MADTTKTKVFGFEIPLKDRLDSSKVDVQKITFSNQDKFIIGAKQDGLSLASIEFMEGKPYLFIDPSQLNLDFTHGFTVLEDGRQAYLLSSLEIDSDSNLNITLTSPEQDVFSSLQFLPNEVIVKKQDDTVQKHQVPTLNLDLPQNLFELTQQEDSFVKVKNLPSQFMSVMKDLKNSTTLNLIHRGKKLSIARVGNKENPTIYIVNGTRMTQHFLEDFYIYNPETEEEKGFLGIKASRTSTSAYGIIDIDSANLNKILNFVSNKQSLSKITMLTKQQLQEQVLKPKNISVARKKSKFTTSITKSKTQQPEVETEIKPEIDPEVTPEVKPEILEVTPEVEPDAQKDEIPAVKKAPADDDTNKNSAQTGKEEDPANIVEGGTNENVSSLIGVEESGNTTEPKVVEDEVEKTEIEPAPQPEEEKKQELPEKVEEKTEKVDLSSFAKLLGIGLAAFGLVTGFGGFLIYFLAIGLSSQEIGFNKKLKNITLPKGAPALKKEVEKAKKEGKVKKLDFTKKSTSKEESAIVNELQKDGFISKELANEAKNIIVDFEKNLGLINKIEEFYNKQLSTFIRISKVLQSNQLVYKAKHKHNEALEFKKQQDKVDKGLIELEKIAEEFKEFKDFYANDLQKQYQVIEEYYEMKHQINEFNANQTAQKDQELKVQLDDLLAQKDDQSEKLSYATNILTLEKEIVEDFKDSSESVRNRTLKNKKIAEDNVKEHQDKIEQLNLTIGKLQKEYDNLQAQVKQNKENVEKVEYLEQSILKPEVITQLKSIMINTTKENFSRFYSQSQKLEDSYKKFARLSKEDKKLAEEVKNFQGHEMQ